MVGICSYGAYVPLLRLRRGDMVELGGFAGEGERSLANFDEDSLTMAVEAVINCLSGIDRQTVDSLFFASTTPPLVEKQVASMAAAVADLREEIFTVDCTDSLRAGTSALKLAADSVKAGSAKKVVVAAADRRVGLPMSMLEQHIGDGAAALLIGNRGVIASIEGYYHLSSEYIDLWRYDGDDYVHAWQDRFAYVGIGGYQETARKAITAALKKFGLEAKDLAKIVYSAPEARGHGILARNLKLDNAQVQNPLFDVMGHTGAAFPLMLLIDALENAKAGDKILLVGYGDGVDVFLLKVTPEIGKLKERRGVRRYLKSKRYVPSYLKYLRIRHFFPVETSRVTEVVPGLSQLWRERGSLLKFYGSKCKKCGWVEYPERRICPKCHSKDEFDEVRLADQKAKLFSYTIDMNPTVSGVTEPSVVRGVVEFKGGARWEGEVEACLEDLEVGMPIEMMFRKLERQGDVPAYSWKSRPIR